MGIKEKLELALSRGFSYDPETGEVKGVRGKPLRKKTKKGYITIQVMLNKKLYYIGAHQFAYYVVHNKIPKMLDHINRDKTDNRIENLRKADYYLNSLNRDSAGCTYIKKRNKWQSTISIRNKKIFLGYYDTREEARAAYLKEKSKYL